MCLELTPELRAKQLPFYTRTKAVKSSALLTKSHVVHVYFRVEMTVFGRMLSFSVNFVMKVHCLT